MEKAQSRKSRTLPPERGAGRIARNRMRIAWMYYVEGLTQNEIADKLGIGRVTVVRNINEAIRQREVKIWIEGEVSECFELEAQLKQAFGFKEAVVVPEPVMPLTRTSASAPLNSAPDATFKSERLFVQSSLALLPPRNVPSCTSISDPEPRLNVATSPPHRIVPAPVLRSVPAPLKEAVPWAIAPLAKNSKTDDVAIENELDP